METGMERSEPPLIVIVGPTASGKTGIAVELARRYGGEIICADSRTVYRDMNVGTAKPTLEEQQGVPHWGIDLISPEERFTAADFQQYAYQKIREIQGRGHVPFVVGGTGLYVDGLLFSYEFGPEPDSQYRHELERMSLEDLQKHSQKNNIILPENPRNKRQLIRTIEQKNINTKRNYKPFDNSIVVGIATDREILNQRIEQRIEQMFDNGVVQEAIKLGEMYSGKTEAFTSDYYPIIHRMLVGVYDEVEAKRLLVIRDRQLAKRQMTWFRRNPFIEWSTLADARKNITRLLGKNL